MERSGEIDPVLEINFDLNRKRNVQWRFLLETQESLCEGFTHRNVIIVGSLVV